MIITALILVILVVIVARVGFLVGEHRGINMAREDAALPPPPKCVHVEARWSRWWRVGEVKNGYSNPVKAELYCVDCGKKFVIELPVSTNTKNISKKNGGPGWKKVRLALSAYGWSWNNASRTFHHTRIED